MEKIEIRVEARTGTGKGVARKLRARGQVPGVFYSHGSTAMAVQVDEAALSRVLRLHGRQSLLVLKSDVKDLDGQHALIKALQHNPLNDHVLHIDLQGVDLGEQVTVSVPLRFEGLPKGEKIGGGRTEHLIHEVEVTCRADSIPHELVVDISDLDIGEVLHVSDVKLPAGVKMHTEGSIALVLVEAPKRAEGEAAAAAEAAKA